MEPVRLSYSSGKVLANCEQEYWHQKVAKTVPDYDFEDNDAFGIGKALHQTLEKTFHTKFIPEILIEAMEEHEVEMEEFEMLSAMCRRYVVLHELSGLTVVAVEFKIDHPSYIGFIDMIMVDSRGFWWIGDLKTTKRLDEKLLPRLCKDMQLNLYSHFRVEVARAFDLDPDKFMGCRYRAITKPALKQKAYEDQDAYISRLEKSVVVHDIEVPAGIMDPQTAWDIQVAANQRANQLHQGEEPHKNFNGCINYFKPCKYFSNCHGHLFTEGHGTVKVHTIQTFKDSEIL